MENESSGKTPALAPAKKLRLLWRILLVLLAAFVIMQFFQPGKNNQSMDMTNDVSKVVAVPDTVAALLKTACYDCHSNFTNYPWYSNIQPVGWWLKDHIDEGKSALNFQEFALLKPKAGGRYTTVAGLQAHKLEEVNEQVKEKEMPLNSYLWIHKEAELTEDQRLAIADWASKAIQQLEGTSNAQPAGAQAEKGDDD